MAYMLLIVCLTFVPCLVCYSGKEAPCLLHRVTIIATLPVSWSHNNCNLAHLLPAVQMTGKQTSILAFLAS